MNTNNNSLISREAVLAALENLYNETPNDRAFYIGYKSGVEEMMDIIKKLPEVGEEPEESPQTEGWIPVADRLPKKGVDVLVWLYDGYSIGRIDYDPFRLSIRWCFEEYDLLDEEMSEVKAWMPLPGPYIANSL